MILGFTGSRGGMTTEQHARCRRLIKSWEITAGHHGDCVGADEELHYLLRDFAPHAQIHVHPPDDPKARAWCEGDVLYPEAPYLVRNEAIVAACRVMLATPHEAQERQRSGTWYTIRKAELASVPTIIVRPDGSVDTSLFRLCLYRPQHQIRHHWRVEENCPVVCSGRLFFIRDYWASVERLTGQRHLYICELHTKWWNGADRHIKGSPRPVKEAS